VDFRNFLCKFSLEVASICKTRFGGEARQWVV
jgi:hypothetical protein